MLIGALSAHEDGATLEPPLDAENAANKREETLMFLRWDFFVRSGGLQFVLRVLK